MKERVEESCSFSPRESGKKMPAENARMLAAPGQEFPEKYYADSVLKLLSYHFHHSAERGGSWAACGISAKAEGRGTKGLSSPLPFNKSIILGWLDLLCCSTSAVPNLVPPILLCPGQVHPKAELRMNAN